MTHSVLLPPAGTYLTLKPNLNGGGFDFKGEWDVFTIQSEIIKDDTRSFLIYPLLTRITENKTLVRC